MSGGCRWAGWVFAHPIYCENKVLVNPIYISITRNPASRASNRVRLVAMYIAVAIRISSYVHRVTSEVAVSFLPEVIAQI